MSQLWANIYLLLWVNKQMTIDQLHVAMAKGRITQAEYDYIASQPQNP